MIARINRTAANFAAALLGLVTVWSGAVMAADEGASQKLHMLVYNTHGIPAFVARDKPAERFPVIAALSRTYDLALLQEDFVHHNALMSGLDNTSIVVRGARSDLPPCLFCSGSGLTMISNLAAQGWSLETRFFAFGTCAGWLTRANDCFAQKGYQLITLKSAQGKRLLVVNTHLDAGNDRSDRDVRAGQLDQIATMIETQAKEEAVVIVGDFNLDWDTEADRALLLAFQDRLGLMRAGDGEQATRGWQVLDYILYRSGAGAKLTVQQADEDQGFKAKAGPLSDHPALFVTFDVR